MVHIWTMLIIIACLILLSAFFSSAETAFTTVNEIKIQVKAEDGNKRAKRVLKILEKKEKMLSAILIGNNVVNIAASSVTTSFAMELFGNAYIAIATGILTIVVLIAGEIIPKSYAAAKAVSISCLYSGPVYCIMTVLTPLTFLVSLLQKLMMKLIKSEEDDTMTEKELMSLIDTGRKDGAIENDEFEMISNVVELDKMCAKDIMVKRPDITFVPQDVTYKELVSIYKETAYTRYPVIDDDGDHVIGTINMKDLIFMDKEAFHLKDILREPRFTFEHKNIDNLLDEMREASINIMIVLDEYGMISGLITLEDILEEIVGEIRDEYDKDEKDDICVLKQGNEFLIDGATSLHDVNEDTGLNLVSREYDSIGGYMIEALDRLPKSGESIVLPNGTKIIAEIVKNNRVEKVHIIMGGKKQAEE